MSGQIEVRMIGQIDRCRLGGGRLELHGQLVAVAAAQADGDRSQHGARIALFAVRTDVRHAHRVADDHGVPVVLVEAYEAAVQMHRAVVVLGQCVRVPVEAELTVGNTIADTTDGRPEVRIVGGQVACERCEEMIYKAS